MYRGVVNPRRVGERGEYNQNTLYEILKELIKRQIWYACL